MCGYTLEFVQGGMNSQESYIVKPNSFILTDVQVTLAGDKIWRGQVSTS